MLLANKVAIVTGSAKGIGKAIALKFAEEGCKVAVVDIAAYEGEGVAEEIRSKGQEAIFVKCDVTRADQVSNMVDYVLSKFGKIDILVNNAGGVSVARTSGIEQSEEDWDKLINLNLKSVFLCCRAVVPHMIPRRYGKIINISSMGCVSPPGSNPGYHAAKAGVIGLTFDLATALAPFNINVNAILPGPIRTAFWDPILQLVKDSERFLSDVGRLMTPLRRCGMPEEVAGAALFLASDLSSYITGALIPVSGGIPLPVISLRDILKEHGLHS